jgi:DNA-binding CsgD family transcriptional regulator/DNA-binding MarR family transcriptional regulator
MLQVTRSAGAGLSARRLHGRGEEQRVLSTLLEKAQASESGVLVLRGPEGIGKSALLTDTVARAEGMRVLQAAGVESESGLAFSGLHQLLRPIEELIDGLPGPQATALGGALGLSADREDDLFLVGAAALTLIASAAEAEPLLCVIEDAQWLDAASLVAITFVARRLQAERIAMLFAVREDDGVADAIATELPELRLEGLDPGASAALIADDASIALAPEVLNRIIASAEGNPLVLLEVPLALSDAQRAGREQLPDPLPLTARLEDAFSSRAALLPDQTQLLLLLAAADSSGETAVILRAARILGVSADDLTAEAEGLLEISQDRVKFRHSLVRSAVYQRATLAELRQVHNALAEVFAQDGEDDLYAWHRAAATVEPADDVAAELERSAERAKARGGYASAARALTRAAVLTSDSSRRGARKLAAAELAATAGESGTARALLEDARRLLTDPLLLADVELLRGKLELELGSGLIAHDIFMSAADDVAELDRARAAQLLLEATRAALYAGDGEALVRTGHRAQQLRRQAGENFELTVSAGLGLFWDEDGSAGRALLDQAVALGEGDPTRFQWAARCALQRGDETTARTFSRREAERARRDGAVTALVISLSRLAFTEILEDRFVSARANASEGLGLASQIGLTNQVGYYHALVAWTAALLGLADETQREAEAALQLARASDGGWTAGAASLALGELELGLARWADAVTHFQAVATTGSPYLDRRSAPSLVLAAVRAGRPDVAAAALDKFEQWVERTGSRSQLALVARSRALLADDEVAVAEFEQATRFHARTPRPFEQGRTELLYGEHLRRAGQRRKARQHLRLALGLFSQTGAVLWHERAAIELRATGETLRRSEGTLLDRLTPQELQIARFVATGASTKAVAAQLFLSPRTVDAHLRNIFRKLAITSRAQLAGLPLADPGEGRVDVE